jgi:hypothetical protein
MDEFVAMTDFTINFLEPFLRMSELELIKEDQQSPWIATS